MTKLDIVRALYDYNEWACNNVLEAASHLTGEEFSRRQGASFDSYSFFEVERDQKQGVRS